MPGAMTRFWWLIVAYCFLLLTPGMTQDKPAVGAGDGIETDKTFTGTVTGKTNGEFKIVKPAGGNDANGTFLGAGTVGAVGMPIKAGISSCDKCKGKTIKVGIWGQGFPTANGNGIVTGATGGNIHFGPAVAIGVQNCPERVFANVNVADQLEFGGVKYKDASLPKLDSVDTWPARLVFSFNSGADVNTSAVMLDFPGFNIDVKPWSKFLVFGYANAKKRENLLFAVAGQGQTATRTDSFVTVIMCSCDADEPNPVAFVEWSHKTTVTYGATQAATTGISVLQGVAIICPTDPPYAGHVATYNAAKAKAQLKGPETDRYSGLGLPIYTPE